MSLCKSLSSEQPSREINKKGRLRSVTTGASIPEHLMSTPLVLYGVGGVLRSIVSALLH